jgi:hypothetical protein
MENSYKFIIKTDTQKVYVLHVFESSEFEPRKYIGLFLYHDDHTNEGVWHHLRHRILYENSIDAIKDKVIEYTEGRNEHITFLQDFQNVA